MIYQVDTLNFHVYDKHCRCKKKVVMKVNTAIKDISERVLLINETHVCEYTRKGNSFFIATKEGYLKLDLFEFNTFFEPTSAPDPIYIHTNKVFVTLDKISFNRIS